MTEEKNFVLWGSSGHAKVLASLIKLHGGQVVALFDNNPKASSVIPGVPLYIGENGFMNWREQKTASAQFYGLVAIGGANGADRVKIYNHFRQYYIKTEPIIHPHASVCDTAQLGAGTQILAQAVVSADTRLGEGCIVNHAATVDHECELGEGVHIAPNATLCGCVKVGKHTMIGAGAVVLPRVTIGENVVVGAGAVVTKDIPSNTVVAGIPAQPVKNS